MATAAVIETACACSPLPHCPFPGGGDFLPSPLRRPPSPAMAHRNVASVSRSMASRSIEDDFGKETGLPLIVCPLCNRERTIELIVKSTEKGNQGRVFFKCPRNVQGMPGRCTFYEFQKTYLKKLVELKYVSIDLEAGLGEAAADWLGEGEAESQPVISKAWKGIENKLDDLISMFKMLIAVLCFSSVVGLIYVLK